MNKKLLTSLLCSTFLFGLSACSSHDTSSIETPTTKVASPNPYGFTSGILE
ncbi:hypothetical protein [Bacillus cereus]|uniref:hypothetical protein n=1 Tax=Bacillus cereus TaxID=1396 RepID=UPI0007B2C098|nr:hypothetical protein [Bacillus cereus]KZD45441.1 hypothetical protein B4083_0358 [Bacillus cereus]